MDGVRPMGGAMDIVRCTAPPAGAVLMRGDSGGDADILETLVKDNIILSSFFFFNFFKLKLYFDY